MNNLPDELKTKILALLPDDETILEALGCNQATIERILYKRLNSNLIEPGDLAKITPDKNVLLKPPTINEADFDKLTITEPMLVTTLIHKDHLYVAIDQIIDEIDKIDEDEIKDDTFIDEIDNLTKIEWTEKTLADSVERLLIHYKPAELVTEFINFFEDDKTTIKLQIACNLLVYSLPMWASEHKGSFFREILSAMGAAIHDCARLYINFASEKCEILGHCVIDFIAAYNKINHK